MCIDLVLYRWHSYIFLDIVVHSPMITDTVHWYLHNPACIYTPPVQCIYRSYSHCYTRAHSDWARQSSANNQHYRSKHWEQCIDRLYKDTRSLVRISARSCYGGNLDRIHIVRVIRIRRANSLLRKWVRRNWPAIDCGVDSLSNKCKSPVLYNLHSHKARCRKVRKPMVCEGSGIQRHTNIYQDVYSGHFCSHHRSADILYSINMIVTE